MVSVLRGAMDLDLVLCSNRSPFHPLNLKTHPPPLPCPAHYAVVTLTFLDRTSETELRLECRGVPASEEEATREGWRRYYFESIRQTFGFGSSLF